MPPATATMAVAKRRRVAEADHRWDRHGADGSAASAADEPETSEKKIVATITTRPRPPGRCAHEDVREVHEPPPHPARLQETRRPGRRAARASTGNESSDVKIFWGRTRRGVRPSMTVVTSAGQPEREGHRGIEEQERPEDA